WILRWPEAGRRWLAGTLLVLSPALASYSGLLFMAIRANPFWAHPLLPAVFWASSLSTGLAFSELAVLAREVRRRYRWHPAWRDFDPWAKPWPAGDLEWLQQLHLLALAGELVFFFLWFTSWLFLPLGPAVFRALWGTGYGLLLGGMVLGLGLLFPLGLGLYARVRSAAERGVLPWLIPLLVLLGGVMLRYIVVFAGQLIFSPRPW
ncbi:MAG: polysulfide reductase NrfD, partial [Bacillota bacterium]|nr:polysulfide reductase NrfD [Bacillota bacterium]